MCSSRLKDLIDPPSVVSKVSFIKIRITLLTNISNVLLVSTLSIVSIPLELELLLETSLEEIQLSLNENVERFEDCVISDWLFNFVGHFPGFYDDFGF